MSSTSETSGRKYACDEAMVVGFQFKLISNQVFLSINFISK